jgi:hypothetical protein
MDVVVTRIREHEPDHPFSANVNGPFKENKLAIIAEKRFSPFAPMRYDLSMSLFGLTLAREAMRTKYEGNFFPASANVLRGPHES